MESQLKSSRETEGDSQQITFNRGAYLASSRAGRGATLSERARERVIKGKTRGEWTGAVSGVGDRGTKRCANLDRRLDQRARRRLA